jgi:hypothetical protein
VLKSPWLKVSLSKRPHIPWLPLKGVMNVVVTVAAVHAVGEDERRGEPRKADPLFEKNKRL